MATTRGTRWSTRTPSATCSHAQALPYRGSLFEEDQQPLRSPEDFWAIALGSGYRGTLEALDPSELDAVRTKTIASMTGVRAVRIPVIYATATRPHT